MAGLPDRLVVGYQGGPTGEDALAFGRRWVSATGDRLTVVTVHPGQAPLGVGRVDAEWAEYEREEAAGLLDRARDLLGDTAADYRRLDAASAAHGLSDLAEGGDTVLVLGARRARGLRRTYPGSTALRLLHGSASPVTIVPSDYAAQGEGPFRTVTVAFVDTPDGRSALDLGAAVATRVGARLDVVSVAPETRMYAGEPTRYRSEGRSGFQESLDRAVARVTGVEEVSGRVLDGPVVDALVEIAPDESDLLVVGSRGYGPVARVLLGGVSDRVVRNARVPVIVAPRAR